MSGTGSCPICGADAGGDLPSGCLNPPLCDRDGGHAEIAALQTRSAPFEASLEFAGRAWTRVDELEIRNDDSETSHAFEITGEIDGFRTRQRLRFPDGTVFADEGMAHEGGVAAFTGLGLMPGRELLFIARSDIVFADGEFELDLGDGQPIRQPDFEEDRRYRWRNRVIWVPGDRIDGDTIRFSMRRVDSDRALSHFCYWLYQPVDAPTTTPAVEPTTDAPAAQPPPTGGDHPDHGGAAPAEASPAEVSPAEAEPPTETVDIPAAALMDPATAIDADVSFLTSTPIAPPLDAAPEDATRRAAPPVTPAEPLPPKRPLLPVTQLHERAAGAPRPAEQHSDPPTPRADGPSAASAQHPAGRAQPPARPVAAALPSPPSPARPAPPPTMITSVPATNAAAVPASEATERLVTIALGADSSSPGITEHLAGALAAGWSIARFEPIAHAAGGWIVVHLERR